jgi:hypothetical protein
MFAALSLAHVLGMAPAASWPASAGVQSPANSVIYKDPKPRFYDPPPGRYRLPDGTFGYADPPEGFHDPPPGYYPVDEAQAVATWTSLGPLPTAEGSIAAWYEKRRRLRIGLGISSGAFALSFLAIPLSNLFWRPSSDGVPCIDCYPPGIIVTLYLGPASVIAAIVYGIRLGVHARRRPKTNLALAPGGLLWRF